MKGNQKIIDALNGLLAMELAAMDRISFTPRCIWIGVKTVRPYQP